MNDLCRQRLRTLSKYLPYDLQIVKASDPSKVYSLMTFSVNRERAVVGPDDPAIMLDEILPILRPFEDLCEYVTYRGKKIRPIIELAKLALDSDDDEIYEFSVSKQDHVLVVDAVTEHTHTAALARDYRIYFWRAGFENEEPGFVGVDEVYPNRADEFGDAIQQTVNLANIGFIMEMLYELHFAVGVSAFTRKPLEQ